MSDNSVYSEDIQLIGGKKRRSKTGVTKRRKSRKSKRAMKGGKLTINGGSLEIFFDGDISLEQPGSTIIGGTKKPKHLEGGEPGKYPRKRLDGGSRKLKSKLEGGTHKKAPHKPIDELEGGTKSDPRKKLNEPDDKKSELYEDSLLGGEDEILGGKKRRKSKKSKKSKRSRRRRSKKSMALEM
jgi:hypothetical protein